METINIGPKNYQVEMVYSDLAKQKGLQGVDHLDEDKGMLFCYDPPQNVAFWMKGVTIPLDIIFINEDQVVTKVVHAKPNDETLISEAEVAYVLEVNVNSRIIEGDTLELQESGPTMKVLFQDGSEQYSLWGGERIFSRKNTKILIKKAKKAQESQLDSDFKALGRYMFKCINKQDTREPEYVQIKNN